MDETESAQALAVEMIERRPTGTTFDDRRLMAKTLVEASKLELVGKNERVFVFVGNSTGMMADGIIRALNALEVDCHFLLVDKTRFARDAWDRLCDSHEGPVKKRLVRCDPGEEDQIRSFLPSNPQWVCVNGCHCYGCVLKSVQLWSVRVQLSGFLGFLQTDPCLARGPIFDMYHDDSQRREHGVLAAVNGSERIKSRFDEYESTEVRRSKTGFFFGSSMWFRREIKIGGS